MCDAAKHGTTYAYKVYRCRCPEVVERMRLNNVAFRAGEPPREPDEMAIARAVSGYPVRLTPDERRMVVVELTRRGMAAAAIAQHLRVSRRTVTRHRAAART